MIATAYAPVAKPVARSDQASLARLMWVAPLTLALALGACLAIRFVAQAIDPQLVGTPQLQMPMMVLTVEGVVAAVGVFVVFGLFVPRPIVWYRIVGGIALLASLLPDVALALGGAPMQTAMSFVGPLIGLGSALQGGSGGSASPSNGGPGAGGPPPGFMSGMSLEQVLVLMSLHVAVGLVSIGLLTTLARKRAAAN